MEFIAQYGLFLAQAVTIVVALLVVLTAIVSLGHRQKGQPDGHIEIRHINDRYKDMADVIRQHVIDKNTFKLEQKAARKAAKQRSKADKKAARSADKKGQGSQASPSKPRLFTLSFDGDMNAGATENLREEISAVLSQTKEGDAILLKLESPGGLVHSYGLAASQLQRIKDAGVPLTIAVDKVAASGGYMMACLADRILAAPFAVIGSIGVLAQIPNFHRLLKKHDIDYELLTAGEYKRTMTMFGENTDKAREKFSQDLELTHELFKSFVKEARPSLDIDKVATGEVWYGRNALQEGLVDEIGTSDAFIQQRLADWEIYEVRYLQKKQWQEKLGMAAESTLERSIQKLWQRSRSPLV